MLFPNSSKDSLAYPELTKGKAAKVSKGRPQSPLVAPAGAKPFCRIDEEDGNGQYSPAGAFAG